MLYPFINAYLKITGKKDKYTFAKITPFALKSDNYAKVYIIEPNIVDKFLSQYHIFNKDTLVKFIETVGGTKTEEIVFITDRTVPDETILRNVFTPTIRKDTPKHIVCKYYYTNGHLIYNLENGFFESAESNPRIKFNHTDTKDIITKLEKKIYIPGNSEMRTLESII